jgi:hypothetical protein
VSSPNPKQHAHQHENSGKQPCTAREHGREGVMFPAVSGIGEQRESEGCQERRGSVQHVRKGPSGQVARFGLQPLADGAGAQLPIGRPVLREAVVHDVVGFDAERILDDPGGAVGSHLASPAGLFAAAAPLQDEALTNP